MQVRSNEQSIQRAICIPEEPTDGPNTQLSSAGIVSATKIQLFPRSHSTELQSSLVLPTLVSEKSPRWSITLEIPTEMRPYLESLRNPDYAGNLDYIDGLVIMFWMIHIRQIVVLIMLTCSI